MASKPSGAAGQPPMASAPGAVHRLELRERATFAASPLQAPMHGAFYLDDDLLAGGQQGLGGLRERTARVREALTDLMERDSARQLARLGGSEPDLGGAANDAPPRRP